MRIEVKVMHDDGTVLLITHVDGLGGGGYRAVIPVVLNARYVWWGFDLRSIIEEQEARRG